MSSVQEPPSKPIIRSCCGLVPTVDWFPKSALLEANFAASAHDRFWHQVWMPKSLCLWPLSNEQRTETDAHVEGLWSRGPIPDVIE